MLINFLREKPFGYDFVFSQEIIRILKGFHRSDIINAPRMQEETTPTTVYRPCIIYEQLVEYE